MKKNINSLWHTVLEGTQQIYLEDLLDQGLWSSLDGKDLEKDHGGPARLLVPHLYL